MIKCNFIDVEKALDTGERVFDNLSRDGKTWMVFDGVVDAAENRFRFCKCCKGDTVVKELVPFLVKEDVSSTLLFCMSLVELLINKFADVKDIHLSYGYQPELIENEDGSKVRRVFIGLALTCE